MSDIRDFAAVIGRKGGRVIVERFYPRLHEDTDTLFFAFYSAFFDQYLDKIDVYRLDDSVFLGLLLERSKPLIDVINRCPYAEAFRHTVGRWHGKRVFVGGYVDGDVFDEIERIYDADIIGVNITPMVFAAVAEYLLCRFKNDDDVSKLATQLFHIAMSMASHDLRYHHLSYYLCKHAPRYYCDLPPHLYSIEFYDHADRGRLTLRAAKLLSLFTSH